MIEPIVGGLVASVLVYLAMAALFTPTAGVVAVLVLGAVGTAALVGAVRDFLQDLPQTIEQLRETDIVSGSDDDSAAPDYHKAWDDEG